MSDQGAIICFGESLWDELPEGRRAGGAPMNVAYHLTRLGRRALPLTAVGADAAGDELLDLYRKWGLDTSAIARHADLPTGRVAVTLDETGAPRYRIEHPSAWDRITLPGTVESAAAECNAIVFGTLAQRSRSNRETLARLREIGTDAITVFDVNLRESFWSRSSALALAHGCTLLKLNNDELALLSGDSRSASSAELRARHLAGITGVGTICVTLGGDGAALLHDDQWIAVPAESAEVVDTVGAGDAFLAVLIDGFLSAAFQPIPTLRRAASLAGVVAGSSGATPEYRTDFMNPG